MGARSWKRALGVLCGRLRVVSIMKGHVDGVFCLRAFEGSQLLSRSMDSTVRLWETSENHGPPSDRARCPEHPAELHCLRGHNGPVFALALLPNGRMVTGSRDCTGAVWDIRSRTCEATLRGHVSPIECVVGMVDGTLITGDGHGCLKMWRQSSDNGVKLPPLLGPCLRRRLAHSIVTGFSGSLELARCMDDVPISVESSCNRQPDRHAWHCASTVMAHKSRVNLLAESSIRRGGRSVPVVISGSSDGSLVATACDHRGDWAVLFSVQGHASAVTCVDCSSTPLLTGSCDRTCRVWSLGATGIGCEAELVGHTRTVSCVQWLPQAAGRLVTASHDKTLRVWDANTAECVWLLKGHTSKIFAMCVLDDGRIVSGSRDKSLRLWEPSEGKCVQTLTGHQGSVWCVAQLSNGLICSGSNDTSVRVWAGVTDGRPELHAEYPAVW